ncbi:alpha/beta fold hydrolase [Brachybacterium hainanense]|uniref:Alpha/beta fold hydrolase n=1 Tax=Brachybacterium hainanense TaxID=1541174 RepID=A0ABV6RHN0_9MICO
MSLHPPPAAPLPLVLVHGTRTSRTQWDPQRPALVAAGHTVLTPDLPGHGERRREPFALDAAMRVLHRAVQRAAADDPRGRAHLAGHSLGAMLAIHAAATLPDPGVLSSLTVIGGSAQAGERSARLYGAVMRSAAAAGRHGSAGLLPRLLLHAEGHRAYVAGGLTASAVIGPAFAALAGLDLRADLARITCPVTILNPRFDQMRVHERSFAAAAPRGRLVVLPYGGHLVNLTAPDRFTADLLRVLREG